MRNVIRSSAILAVLLAAASAGAQRLNVIEANVPFAFQIAGREVPAGAYWFSFDQKTEQVTIKSGKSIAFVFATAPNDQLARQHSFLRFQRCGNEWLLHEISFAGTAQDIPLSRAMKKLLASQACPGGKAVVEGAAQPFEPSSPQLKEN